MSTSRIAFVGGGNMARALIGGLLRRGHPAAAVRVGEPLASARIALENDFGVWAGDDNRVAIDGADTIVLAVKPQDLGVVLPPLAQKLALQGGVLVSIAAGVPVSRLRAWLGASVPIVRAMPNRPALVGAGISGAHAPADVTPAQRQRAQQVLEAAGEVVWIDDESLMDAVTAVSGSGPAYFFALAEALAQAGAAAGLPEPIARRLATATLAGAGRMIDGSGADVALLRAEVTSRGGTTEAALRSLEQDRWSDALGRAVDAAVRRGRELAAASGSLPSSAATKK